MSGLEVSQSVLSPAGPQASSIYSLWSLMLWTCTAVFVAVLAALSVALIRGLRNRDVPGSSPPTEVSLSRSVGFAVAVTVTILITLLVASVWTGRQMASLQSSSAATI